MGDTGQEDWGQQSHPWLFALPQLQPQVPDGLQCLSHAGKGSHCCVPSGVTPGPLWLLAWTPRAQGLGWEKEKWSSWRGDGTQILPLCSAQLVVAHPGDRQDRPQVAQEGASPVWHRGRNGSALLGVPIIPWGFCPSPGSPAFLASPFLVGSHLPTGSTSLTEVSVLSGVSL